MPVLDGWGVLQELRADERTRGLPCIAVTAFSSDADRARAIDAGFNAYLTKPFGGKDLLATVQSLIANGDRQ